MRSILACALIVIIGPGLELSAGEGEEGNSSAAASASASARRAATERIAAHSVSASASALDSTFAAWQPSSAIEGARSDGDDEAGIPEAATADANAFGRAGSWRWAIIGGAAFDIKDDGEQYNAHWAASYFFADDFNLSLEFGGFFFDQPSRLNADTGGGNFNLLFRWHFLQKESWSLYADGGAGVLLAGEEIPEGGSNFNFTPQAGLGASFQLSDDSDVRLLTGVRWHHISNANTAGSDNNPGRDSIMGYIGLDFPF